MSKVTGGNVIPNAKPITRQNFQIVKDTLAMLMPRGINIYPIGSAGHKEISKDLDVLIDASELQQFFDVSTLKLAKQNLQTYFECRGLFSAKSGVSVHVGIPTGAGDEVVQVDIMAVENAACAVPLHTHDYTREPGLKGGTLHAIWADLANLTSLPDHPHLMMSPYRGLLNRNSRELIASDKDAIAKIIIGPAASAADMGSVSAILTALRPYASKYDSIKDKYAPEFAHT